MRHMLMLAVALALAGCDHAPTRVGLMSTEELQAAVAFDLCGAYAIEPLEEVRGELQRREAIPPEEWALIDEHRLQVGMTELGLACSWGYPSRFGSVSWSRGPDGSTGFWIFRSCATCAPRYAFTENGRLVRWQE